jgi:hypothetical protein
MSLSAREIIEVMERAKELGMKHVKMDGFEASFDEMKANVPTQVVPDEPKEARPPTDDEVFKHLSILDEIDEEALKYWSTPYYDEILAQRASHQHKLDEEKKVKNG